MKMKAAIFRGAHKPLSIEEVPVPEIGPGEVLIRVAACGICHTDLHYLDHGVPTAKPAPLVLGHEASGRVVRAAPDVKSLHEGDPVVVPAVITCGSCEMCRRGRENICRDMRMLGNHRDGALAEYLAAPARDVFRLPDSIPLDEACLIADAISTGFHAAVRRGQVSPGDRVAVWGCGGVGLNVIQVAAMLGAEVWAIDRDIGRLTIARILGAKEIIRATDDGMDVARGIKKATGGGADVAFEVIGNPVTIRLAAESIRPGGRLAIVGYSAEDVTLPASRIMFFEQDVVGSLGCRNCEYPRIIELVRSGRLRTAPLVTGRYSLEEANVALDALRAGRGVRNIVVP